MHDLEIYPNLRRTDLDIGDDLRQAIALSGLPIEVTCEDGVVTFVGTVQNRSQKQLAERIAGFVLGVRAVRDQLTFDEALGA